MSSEKWGQAAFLLCVLFAACTCPGPGPDGGVPDSGTPDASVEDAGPPDAGRPDAGPQRDAGPLPDAGTLRCLQVSCIGDNTCSYADGECSCNGNACQLGQTCECPQAMPGCMPGERACVASTRCDSVTCTNGSQCDLADGLCKCTGSGGPVCSDSQACGAARPAQCSGGCAQLCDDGMSCDAEDQTCKCGGRGGAPCSADEVCVSTSSQYACRLACAVGAPCPTAQHCFIDTRPSLDVAYCAFASGQLGEGEQCVSSTQCFDGRVLHCAGLTAVVPVGTCRLACDPSAPQCPAGRRCVGLVDLRDAGFCVP